MEIFRFWRWRLNPERPVVERVMRSEDAIVAQVPDLRNEPIHLPEPPPFDPARKHD